LKIPVAIIGVGLIGGSLGQALRRTGKYRVIGIGRQRSKLRQARRLGAIDEGSLRLADAAKAKIIVIGAPVDDILPLARRLLPHLRPGSIVTDVGSVKQPIVDGFARLAAKSKILFVGSHPLAGSHKTGVKAANPNLFRGSTCVVVRVGKAPVNAIAGLWKAVGARVRTMSAADHDAAVALTSHLPHAMAHALVHVIAGRRDRNVLTTLLAGSFRDMTRVASSDPEQWAQILRANAPALTRALAQFRRELNRLEAQLRSPRLRSHLRHSHNFRRPLFNAL